MKLLALCTAALLAVQATGASIKHRLSGFTLTEHSDPVQRDFLQKYVRISSSSSRYADLRS